jgi:hypothetical protein
LTLGYVFFPSPPFSSFPYFWYYYFLQNRYVAFTPKSPANLRLLSEKDILFLCEGIKFNGKKKILFILFYLRSTKNMQAQVEEMVIRGQKGFSGFITADTKFVFRSRYIFPHSLPHSLTPSLPHSLTPSLPHSLTPLPFSL